MYQNNIQLKDRIEEEIEDLLGIQPNRRTVNQKRRLSYLQQLEKKIKNGEYDKKLLLKANKL